AEHGTALCLDGAIQQDLARLQPAEREALRSTVNAPLHESMWNAAWMSDTAGNTLTYMGVVASAREFAKFGYLYLRGGVWEGQQILSADWVSESTQPSQIMNPFYGYLWWLNTAGATWPNVPEDAFAAMGMNEKRIYVVPSLDIVAVRLGAPQAAWNDNAFLGRVCASVIE
ncbi:MAG: hypothetical protein C4532_13805, partial [Candidatus Abyssobacteria bacterium SURF_17]